MSRVGFQASYDAPFDGTFGYVVAPRQQSYAKDPQPAYVALNIGGHDGVRVSLTPTDARDLVELLQQVLADDLPTDIDADGPVIRISELRRAAAEVPA